MTDSRYAIHTMGCKLNFYDSEVIGTAFEKEGFIRSDDIYSADLLLLNSCTVTNNSDAEARNLIRKFRRRNPNGFLVVTGCYAQAKKEDVEAMQEVDFVTTNVNKYDVTPIIRAFKGAAEPHFEDHDIMEKRPAEYRLLEKFDAKTRAFVKIQDGCNLRCAYCIIPFVRGNNRSVPLDAVLEQIERLEQGGVREVVLTGIHIGTWGRDFQPKREFADLIQALDESSLKTWIRISSLDSPEIPDRLIETIKQSRKIVPHLHIPLQSGHNETLKRMARGYTVEQFAERVQRLKQEIPPICLGADVIVGFPGETEEEFMGTEAFLKSIPMDYLHVFPYSNRSGTRASQMKNQVNGRVIKNRARILREFSGERRRAHELRHHGSRREAILIRHKDAETPLMALTDNYLECGIPALELKRFAAMYGPVHAGQRVQVEIRTRDQSPPSAQPVAILD